MTNRKSSVDKSNSATLTSPVVRSGSSSVPTVARQYAFRIASTLDMTIDEKESMKHVIDGRGFITDGYRIGCYTASDCVKAMLTTFNNQTFNILTMFIVPILPFVYMPSIFGTVDKSYLASTVTMSVLALLAMITHTFFSVGFHTLNTIDQAHHTLWQRLDVLFMFITAPVKACTFAYFYCRCSVTAGVMLALATAYVSVPNALFIMSPAHAQETKATRTMRLVRLLLTIFIPLLSILFIKAAKPVLATTPVPYAVDDATVALSITAAAGAPFTIYDLVNVYIDVEAMFPYALLQVASMLMVAIVYPFRIPEAIWGTSPPRAVALFMSYSPFHSHCLVHWGYAAFVWATWRSFLAAADTCPV